MMRSVPSSSGMVERIEAGIYFNTRELQRSDKQELNKRHGQNVSTNKQLTRVGRLLIL